MPSYLLDTNVLRELHGTNPSPKVLGWIADQNKETLYISTLNIAEVLFGIEQLPHSKKRALLEAWLHDLLFPNFTGRILSFDLNAAMIWGRIAAQHKRVGRPRPYMDSLLAAVALANGMTLVTRNTIDFSGLGLDLVNPF